MNLYLITSKISVGYDAYDSAVVAAATVEDARIIHPGGGYCYRKDLGGWTLRKEDCVGHTTGWVKPENVDVKLIGTTDPYREGDVILASFIAG